MFDRAKVYTSDTGKCFELVKELGRGSYGIVTLVSHDKIKQGEKIQHRSHSDSSLGFDKINKLGGVFFFKALNFKLNDQLLNLKKSASMWF